MDKRTPFVQGLAGAALAAVLLVAFQVFLGTRPAGPVIYAFIALLAIVAGVLSYVRAAAKLRGPVNGHDSPLVRTPFRTALSFLGIVLYGYAFNRLFVTEPGDSQVQAMVTAIVLAATLVVLMYRRSRRLDTSFWKILAGAVAMGVCGGVLTWALRKFV
jgi:hypothetical protein